MTTQPVLLREDQVDEAGAALARGFFDDPLLVYVLPDDSDRRRRAPAHFAAIVRYGVLFGDVYTTPGGAGGAAVWFRPGEPDVLEERAEPSGMARMPEILGLDGFARMENVLAPLQAVHHADAPEPHWYLPLLGVDAHLQGQGIGSALLQPILHRADNDGLRCYVETAQSRNVPFYERHGFSVMRLVEDRPSGVTLWTFVREAVIT